MPGFRVFKGLGRRKDRDEESFVPAPAGQSTFRVLTRDSLSPTPIDPNSGLPQALDRRSWAGNERDAGVLSDRGNQHGSNSASSRFSILDSKLSSNRSGPENSDRSSLAYQSGPMARGQLPNRPLGKSRSAFLDIPGISVGFGEDMFTGIGDEVKPVAPPHTLLRSETEPHMPLANEWEPRPRVTPVKTPPLGYNQAELTPSPYSEDSRTSRDGLLSTSVSAESSPSPNPPPHSHHFSRPYNAQYQGLDTLAPPPGFHTMKRIESNESFIRSGGGEDTDANAVRKSYTERQQKSVSKPSPLARPEPKSAARLSKVLPPKSSLQPTETMTTSSDTSIKTPSMSSNSSLGLSDDGDLRYESYSGPSNSSTPRPGGPQLIPLRVPIIRQNDEDIPLADIQPALQQKRMSQIPVQRPGAAPIQMPNHSRTPSRLGSNEYTNSPGNSTIRAVVRNSTIEAPRPAVTRDASPINDARVRRQSTASPDLPGIPAPSSIANRASQSTPDLPSRKPNGTSPSAPAVARPNPPSRSATPSASRVSSDDDEDIPLAILQANNFPTSRTKTPDQRLSQSPSMFSMGNRTSSYGTMPSAGGGGIPRGSLPPFARGLPDAEAVFANPMAPGHNRMSSMMSGRGPPPPGTSPVVGMPPGGLVGVIAEEEKARGIRRMGNHNPSTALNPAMSMGMGGMSMNIPGVGPGLGMGMGNPYEAGMNQQMMAMALQGFMQQTAYIQEQNAMLLDYIGRTGGGSVAGSPVMMQDGFNSMPASPMVGGRPASAMGGGYVGQQLTTQQQMQMLMSGAMPQQQQQQVNPMMGMGAHHPRSQSMVNIARPNLGGRRTSMAGDGMAFGMPGQNMMAMGMPSMGQQDVWETQSIAGATRPGSVRGLGLSHQYAPSIAPSERSTIGQPSRYRPVSQAGHYNDTASVMNSTGISQNLGLNLSGGSTASLAPNGNNPALHNSASSGRLSMNGMPVGLHSSRVHAPAPNAKNVEEAQKWSNKRTAVVSALLHPQGGASVMGSEEGAEEEEDWGRFARRRGKK